MYKMISMSKTFFCVSSDIITYYFITYSVVNSVAQSIVFNQIKVEGFIVSRWLDKFTTAIMELKGWLDEVSILHSFYLYLNTVLMNIICPSELV